MPRPFSRTVSALALLLAAGTPGPAPAASAQPPGTARAVAAQPARVLLAQAHARSLRSQLGLSGSTDFTVHHAFTNSQGTTIVRLQQTHLGHPVWSGTAVVHVGADGAVQKVVQALAPAVQLSGAPALSADQARAIALKSLAAQGPLDGPASVTQVVFPTRNVGGFTTRLDEATGKVVLDRELSTWARRPAGDYVWAYLVGTSLRNPRDGMKQIAFVVDGTTGAILKKWNALKSDSPAQGQGASLYHGTVVLQDTQAAADGSYLLLDPARGTQPNPYWAVANVGVATYYTALHFEPAWGSDTFVSVPYRAAANDAWGDGQPFNGTALFTDPVTGDRWWAGAPDANGQTAAVDAQFGLATTWDLYQNVFGRNGPDGTGLTLNAVVHDIVPVFRGSGVQKRTNHFFNGGTGWFSWGLATAFLGDGSYPEDPDGTWPQTDVDIIGHELTHAFTYTTANFNPNAAEPPGLEEATCDILGQAAKAYALRAAGADDVIPDFPTTDLSNWTFGYQADRGHPERYFYKPSLDGVSPDGWYDGLGALWPWYAAGPINRMFFFLSQGASAVPTDPDYSVYLPTGMAGIGIDKASRIWFKAVAENMTSETTIQYGVTYSDTTQQTALQAASDAAVTLYGDGSPEQLAVLDAFYAANIGDGAPGRPKHVQVLLPVLHPAGSLLGDGGTNWNGFPSGYNGKIQFYPPGTTVRLLVDVANASDTSVTWSAAGVGNMTDVIRGGTFNADGSWTTPAVPSADFQPFLLTATSKAEPSQQAKLSVLVVAIDADLDSEADALDLGQIAITWGLASNPFPSTNIWSSGTPGDWDVALFNEVLTNTWPARKAP